MISFYSKAYTSLILYYDNVLMLPVTIYYYVELQDHANMTTLCIVGSVPVWNEERFLGCRPTHLPCLISDQCLVDQSQLNCNIGDSGHIIDFY